MSAIVVTPSPIVAGGTLTVTLTTSHITGVEWAEADMYGPGDGRLPWQTEPCGGMRQSFTPQPGDGVVITMSCVMPTFATNGTWRMRVHLGADNSFGQLAETQFEVVGGSDDDAAPVGVTTTPPPSTVQRGGSFTIGLQVTEEHPWQPSNYYIPSFDLTPHAPDRLYGLECGQPSVPVVGFITEVEIPCTVQADVPLGTYSARYFLTDALGHTSFVDWQTTVVA